MNLGIIGYGWLAERFARKYGKYYQIFPTTTTLEKYERLLKFGFSATKINFSNYDFEKQWHFLEILDIILITVPLSVRFDLPENAQRKIDNIIQFMGNFGGQVILISSTGIYPQNEGVYFEKDYPPNEVFTEKHFVNNFPKTTVLRCGGLMGDDRYISKYQITKDLNQTVNYVHYEDVASAIHLTIQKSIVGEAFNVVAPVHPTKQQVLYYERHHQLTEAGTTLKRIISSDKLVETLHYQFIHANPLYFKEA